MQHTLVRVTSLVVVLAAELQRDFVPFGAAVAEEHTPRGHGAASRAHPQQQTRRFLGLIGSMVTQDVIVKLSITYL